MPSIKQLMTRHIRPVIGANNVNIKNKKKLNEYDYEIMVKNAVKVTDDIQQHRFFVLPARLVGFIPARKQKLPNL